MPNPRTVIIGGGFAGLSCAKALGGAPTDVTLIDQRNYHLFQPLLYQAATALLSPSEIAWPIRTLLRRYKNIQTLLGTVVGVDRAARVVHLEGRQSVPFDYLVVATGARHAYFGHDDWEAFAPGLKNLDDATDIRRKILLAFEQAEFEPDPAKRAALLTFVIIGGGPTGVELAGMIAELTRRTLPGEFRAFSPQSARVILVEANARILTTFTEPLSDFAVRSLADMGVEVLAGKAVTHIDAKGVVVGDEPIEAATVLWAAGVQASPAALWLHAASDRAGRVIVGPDLSIEAGIWVIGDTAAAQSEGKPVPGLAPAAKQQGKYVAAEIRRRLRGDAKPSAPFRYRNQGNLATVSRKAAIAEFPHLRLKGWIAWWLWGIAHIFFLIGARNRLAVALNWLWAHATGGRGARLITRHDEHGRSDQDDLRPSHRRH
ncbi:NADH dehydrogenase [Kaistia sp. 32K]|uniref:NAD(P)/FAD-dependent oxidoreductase n=1 Tax=Kaistia sp. 32K TaxID=2795690 RepID=UPI0019163713|nr:NAD(P)/FAD-dependent oxidoreductase [Kaistia sp. 32K]BCP53623.1 NADH dehydrogenase [Kaistia sp. 32K]